jgi:hypothetical protein
MNSLPRSRRARNWTVWLGLLAMCLIVFAPLVSQSLAAARAGQARIEAIEHELCSADGPDAAPMHSDHGGMQHGDPMSACGYCDFLAGHAAVPAVPPVALVLVALVLIALAPLPSLRHVAFGAFPSGRPRGPPVSPLLAV